MNEQLERKRKAMIAATKEILIVLSLLIATAIGYQWGKLDRPPFPCDEERRIAWNDGLTLGYSEALEGHRRPPLEAVP